jgi:hypothetical protein
VKEEAKPQTEETDDADDLVKSYITPSHTSLINVLLYSLI